MRSAGVATLGALLAGCAIHGFIPTTLRAGEGASSRAEVTELSFTTDREFVWLHARLTGGAGARLRDARVSAQCEKPCEAGTPALELNIDRRARWEELVPAEGEHGVDVRVPAALATRADAALDFALEGECVRVPLRSGSAGTDWRYRPALGGGSWVEVQVPTRPVGGLGTAAGADARVEWWLGSRFAAGLDVPLGYGTNAAGSSPRGLLVLDPGVVAEAVVLRRGRFDSSFVARYHAPIDRTAAVGQGPELGLHLQWDRDQWPAGFATDEALSAWDVGFTGGALFAVDGSAPSWGWVFGVSIGLRGNFQTNTGER